MNETAARILATLLERHRVMAFFAIAYTISWGSFALAHGPAYFPFGPFLAALVLAAATGGPGAVRSWVLRTLRRPATLQWYWWAIALPVSLAGAALLAGIAGGNLPVPTLPAISWSGALLIFPLALIDAPLWEEAGWRGFALPGFRTNRSPLANTIFLSVLLVGWHLPVASQAPALFVQYLIATFASGIVTNWIFYQSGQCTLVAILFHTAQNSAGGVLFGKLYAAQDLSLLWWLFAAAYSATALLCIPLIIRIQKPERIT